MKKKINLKIIFLTAILLFAAFLRLYALGNSSFWIDEATSAVASKQITKIGFPIFDSGLSYSRALVFHYLQAFFMFFFMSEFGARFISVIFGLLTIFLAYKIGKQYSKSGGIISALFMSTFYLEVFFSRQARFYQLFQLMFFLSLYLLYKSKEKPKFLWLAILSFIICYDSQLAGLILAPFFILHILIYNRKQWYWSLIPALFLLQWVSTLFGLSSGSQEMTINYAGRYFAYITNMLYLLILFVPGLIWSYFKNKRLTLTLILPSLVLLIGVFSLKTFAFRYSYFFVFPLILYSSLLLSFLYEKYGKIMLISILLLIIFPSNLFFSLTYVTVLKPIDYNFHDYSAPSTNYKLLNESIISELKSNITLISLFSSDVEWYIRKPDFVIPFSMNGIGDDQISYNSSSGLVVDRYSGARIINYSSIPSKPYNVLADSYSVSKLKPYQLENFNKLIANCSINHTSYDLKVYKCWA